DLGLGACGKDRTLHCLECAYHSDPLTPTGKWLLPCYNAFKKVPTLRRQRFSEWHLRNCNLPLWNACTKRGKRIRIGSPIGRVAYQFLVNAHWLVHVHVVERQHTLFANYRAVPGLPRIEPGGV